MNTDQPTPREEKKADFKPGTCEICKPFICNCTEIEAKKSASQPEPAKDEWWRWEYCGHVEYTHQAKVFAGHETVFYIYKYSKEAAEAIAKQIVEAVNFDRSIPKFKATLEENNRLRTELEQSRAIHKSANESYEALLSHHANIQKELEQAKALYQDRCQAVAKLREELEQANDLCASKSNLLLNIADTLRSRGFQAGLLSPMDSRVIAMAQELDKARARIEGLEKYAGHKSNCPSKILSIESQRRAHCVCGLSALLEK